jgi:adenine specific DNA methylase Mod
MGTLYYGDNLDILRRYLKDETVDLVYLDPPFNSAQNYNAFFHEKDGTDAASQIRAFEDIWHWDTETAREYNKLTEQADERVRKVMVAFYEFLGGNDMMAYLTMMSPRLVELRRVLKPTGSLYLHCHPTASHYLKLLCDAIFGGQNFRNEIIWERTTGRKSVSQFGRVHDIILFYSKNPQATWNEITLPQSEESAKGHDLMRDENGLFRVSDLSGAGQGPARSFGGKAIQPPAGRHWQYDQAGMDELWADGRIIFSKNGNPRLKTYLKDLPGVSVRDIWTDIEPVNSGAAERLGYPTQKPVALLERIVLASTNPGGLVLDPFCGCGTTIDAAEKNGRDWIGIDVTQLAISLIKNRLQDTYGSRMKFVSGGAHAPRQ